MIKLLLRKLFSPTISFFHTVVMMGITALVVQDRLSMLETFFVIWLVLIIDTVLRKVSQND